MEKVIEKELLDICKEIKILGYSFEEWKEAESGDMFQSEHYCGGFDGDDGVFWFSYFDDFNNESYFKIDFLEIDDIISGRKKTIVLEEPK